MAVDACDEKVKEYKRQIEDAVETYQGLLAANQNLCPTPSHLVSLEGLDVCDFSSQYGSENSYSYVASNLAGKLSIFPSYGDFVNACVFRTYGPWWSMAPSAVSRYKRTPSDFTSVDFIEVTFKEALYPSSIEVYETYNCGSIVRILACDMSGGTSTDSGTVKWMTLWEGGHEPYTKPRIFSPPLKRADFPTNLIRLELNHDRQEYYTELDAIRLVGARHRDNSKPHSGNLKGHVQLSGEVEDLCEAFDKLDSQESGHSEVDRQDKLDCECEDCYFTFLPEEVIQLLLSYLNTRDLCRLAQTCRLLRDQCYDPLLYTDLNLQPYWTQVVGSTLTLLACRCTSVKRLNLSWCGKAGPLDTKALETFLQSVSGSIVALEMASCTFVSSSVLENIMTICCNLTELNLQGCVGISDFSAFIHIPLTNLRKLNLYRTMIDVPPLAALFGHSPNLEHLNIGSCTRLMTGIGYVLRGLGMHCRYLKSLDLWRMKTLKMEPFSHLCSNCTYLEEVDLGWCTELKSDRNCFVNLAINCPNLRKIYLTANRSVCDKDLIAFAECCPRLEQLDLLGSRSISDNIVLRLLQSCKQLKMLDLSFCNGITLKDVFVWRQMFPAVAIKKSFQNVHDL